MSKLKPTSYMASFKDENNQFINNQLNNTEIDKNKLYTIREN